MILQKILAFFDKNYDKALKEDTMGIGKGKDQVISIKNIIKYTQLKSK